MMFWLSAYIKREPPSGTESVKLTFLDSGDLRDSWDFFLVDFVVPWRNRRSWTWRRQHRTRTTLIGKNLWPVSVGNHHQSDDSDKFGPSAMSSSPRSSRTSGIKGNTKSINRLNTYYVKVKSFILFVRGLLTSRYALPMNLFFLAKTLLASSIGTHPPIFFRCQHCQLNNPESRRYS